MTKAKLRLIASVTLTISIGATCWDPCYWDTLFSSPCGGHLFYCLR